jgi:hypothetical protein
MLSKLVDSPAERLRQRSIYKYFLFLAIAICAMPSAAIAETSTGSINISLEVLPKCSTPVTSSTELSDRENVAQHLDIKCSPRSKPADVRVVPTVVDAANSNETQNNTVNILVGY